MEELFNLLARIHPISEPLQDHLCRTVKERQLAKRSYLLKAGHVCRTVSFIQRGLLRCYYMKEDQEITSWFMKEGDVVVSIESFYHQQPSYEAIQALEDCTVFTIECNELQAIYRAFPEFNFIGRILTEKYHVLWAQQLYALRMQSATERYKWLLDHHPELILRVPAKFIASYLGIEETTLSKIKSGRR